MDLQGEGWYAHRPRERALSPLPPFGKALGDFIENRADRKRRITTEQVDSVTPDGKVLIRGNILPVTGNVPIVAGETVAVAWRDGKMDVVLLNQGRRGGASASEAQQVLGLVEELFILDDAVWFRNHDQFIPMRYASGDAPAERGVTVISQAVWGKGDADFLVLVGENASSHLVMAVYRLNRPAKNEPFPTGARIVATFVALYNFSTDPLTFGSVTLTGTLDGGGQVGTVIGSLTYTAIVTLPSGGGATDSPFAVTARAVTSVGGVAPNGDLLVVVLIIAEHIGQGGQTDQVFRMGSLLVNATRSLVLENRVAGLLSANVYVSSDVVCTLLGTVSVALSLGGPVADAGEITLMSLTGANPNEAGTFNNYLLAHPATVFAAALNSGLFCNPTRAALLFSVIGDFGDDNISFASFPGSPAGPSVAQVPRLQASRTMVLWAPYTENGDVAGTLQIRDLRRGVTSALEGDSEHVFGFFDPFEPDAASVQRPALQALQASLLYTAHDSRAPFNRQFFVAGHNRTTGAVQLNVDALRRVSSLRAQSEIEEARSASQVAIVTAGGGVRQAINSRRMLGPLFQAGPL